MVQVHEKTKNHLCSSCGKSFGRRDNLNRHQRIVHHSSATTPHQVGWGGKRKGEEGSSSSSSSDPIPPKVLKAHRSEKESLKALPPPIKEMYQKYWRAVKTHKRPGKSQSVYTMFWDPCLDSPDWDERLLTMFHEQNKCFKINFSHSFLLRHKESDTLSFFHASHNNHSAMEHPRLIGSKQDFLSFLHEISDHDVLGHVQKERPNSRYSVVNIMATSFYIYPLSNFPIQ